MSDGTATWEYQYNADGLRTSRSNGTTTYEYVYNGSQLVQMTVGSDTLYFTSDTVTYNGTVYYYVKNLQGDVTAIINSSGAPAVLYAYDAWGNILTIDGTMADTLGVLNPIRYRGYVYDSESGLYYLQSRYYDPEVGRFINADALVSTGQGLLGNNMFAYCLNNPIKYGDNTGCDAVILYDEDLPGHIGALVQDEDGKWWHFYWGTEGGFWGIPKRVACFFGQFVPVYTWCVEYDGEVDLESINNAKQFSGDYEAMYYLEGDFTESLDEFKDPFGWYHLFGNNCSQKTLRTLAKADSMYSGMLKRASKKTLPANANKEIERYFAMRDYFEAHSLK